jgi:hypothetical protein
LLMLRTSTEEQGITPSRERADNLMTVTEHLWKHLEGLRPS